VIDFAVIEPKLYFIVDEIKTDENWSWSRCIKWFHLFCLGYWVEHSNKNVLATDGTNDLPVLDPRTKCHVSQNKLRITVSLLGVLILVFLTLFYHIYFKATIWDSYSCLWLGELLALLEP
jgi:hypothetical protein